MISSFVFGWILLTFGFLGEPSVHSEEETRSLASPKFQSTGIGLFGLSIQCEGAKAYRVVEESKPGQIKVLARGDQRSCYRVYLNELGERHGDGCWNLSTATFGGLQFWSDEFVHAGWRIQRNLCTDHYRLLDPDDWREAWDCDYEPCRVAFEKVRLKKGLKPKSSEVAVLVHGLCRSRHYFDEMAKSLRLAGLEVVSVNYASGLGSVEDHAQGLALVLDRLIGAERVHFVTHSLGGLIVRQLFERTRAWESQLKTGRLVMVAPPNQGSAIVEKVSDSFVYDLFGSEIFDDLRPERAASLPTPKLPFGVIAGSRGTQNGFNPALQGDDDGVVRLESTKLEGMSDFFTLDAYHTRMLKDPRAIDATIRYLKTGRFRSLSSIY